MAANPQPSQMDTFRAWVTRPPVMSAVIVGYLLVTVLLQIALDRNNLWYPLTTICVFPLLILAPLVIALAPIGTRLKISLVCIVLLVVMPLLGIYNTSYLELAIQISISAGLALGLNIVVGFAGLLDLGYVAFFAVGAYLWGSFTSGAETVFRQNGIIAPDWAFFIFIVIAIVLAGMVGVLLGLPVLRLRGDYLAIVTLGFGEVIRVLARNGDSPVNITNGSQGLHAIGTPPLPQVAVDVTQALGGMLQIRMDNPDAVAKQLLFYFLAIAVVGVIILVARRLQVSPIGRAWEAIREDEVAAIAMGVPLVRMKLLAFATGASFGGAIGVLYAAKQSFIDPSSFVLLQSITILAMVIVGGMGGIQGVLLGAGIVTLLEIHVLTNLTLQLNALRNLDFVVPIINFHVRDWPSQLEPAKYQPLVFGLILVLMMIFRPAGVLPEKRRSMELMRPRQDDETPVTNVGEQEVTK